MAELINGLRTYRPVLDKYVFCSEVLQQQTQSWIEGVLSGKASRALMLVGDSGFGKTTLGLAACKKLGAAEVDIREINCADLRTLDDARNLLETINFAPAQGDFRVLMLDEVHQMVPNAQQAFLTPLEKLPRRTIIVACSSQPEKLLPAFRGRFCELKITEYSEEAILDILGQLPFDLKPSTQAMIARMAGGNPRRAIALAERNPGAPEQEQELLKEVLRVEHFFNGVMKGDAKLAHTVAKQLGEDGRMLFFEKTLRYLESAWMVRQGLSVMLPPKELASVKAACNSKSLQDIARIHGELLQLSEKPLQYLKSWSMRVM